MLFNSTYTLIYPTLKCRKACRVKAIDITLFFITNGWKTAICHPRGVLNTQSRPIYRNMYYCSQFDIHSHSVPHNHKNSVIFPYELTGSSIVTLF